MLVDYLSDIHLDFWVKPNAPEYVQRKQISEFIKPFIPEIPSKILIIPGDLGHDNDQILILFEVLLETYKHIVFVCGNHDYYLLSLSQKHLYKYDSFKRIDDLVSMSSKMEGVYYLSGMMEIEGIKIGGCSMWYDNIYGVEVCGRSPIFINQLWKQYMSDSKFIFSKGNEYPKMDWLAYCKSQKEILESVYRDCQLIISHVSPDWSNLKIHYQNDPTSTFFHFDGRDILKNCRDKTWLFGHTHEYYSYITTSGCRMFCNPLGYPGERGSFSERNLESFMIRTIEV